MLERADTLGAELASELRAPLHTLKGEARMLGLTSLAALVHALEDHITEDEDGTASADEDLGLGLARLRAGVALVHQRLRAPLVEDTQAVRALEHGLALLRGDEPGETREHPAAEIATPPATPTTFSQVRMDVVDELCERLEGLRMRLHASTAADHPLRHEVAEFDRARVDVAAGADRAGALEPRRARPRARSPARQAPACADRRWRGAARTLAARAPASAAHALNPNAVDHGIEPSDARGDKPAEATLEIIVRSAGPEVEITVVDERTWRRRPRACSPARG